MPCYKDVKRNTWYYDFRKVVDGVKYRHKKSGFKTKQEAMIAELKALEDIKTPLTEVYKKYTWNDIAAKYLQYRKTKIKITTLESEGLMYKNHISPFFGDFRAFNTKADKIFEWKENLVKNGFGEMFTNKVIALFKNIIKFALNKDIISDKKLLDELEPVKLNKVVPERTVWTLDQVKQFLDSFLKDDDTEYMYWLYFYGLAYSGMRPNEYRALTKADIVGDYLVVNKSITSKVHNNNKGDIIQTPKNPNSNRRVLMPHEIIELLNEYTKNYKPSEYIFGRNKALRETTLQRQLDKHQSYCNLPHIVLYGFRHSHATNLIRAGVPIKVVSKRLGHKDASTTMNVYWHLFNDDEKQVLDVLK